MNSARGLIFRRAGEFDVLVVLMVNVDGNL